LDRRLRLLRGLRVLEGRLSLLQRLLACLGDLFIGVGALPGDLYLFVLDDLRQFDRS